MPHSVADQTDKPMKRLNCASKHREMNNWEGKDTIAYLSESSKENFLSLPDEAHARLQLASAQLNSQNSAAQRLLVGKLQPLKISAVEQYELARYRIDWPSPTAEKHVAVLPPRRKPSNTVLARIRYNKTKEDYMEYLWAQVPRWEISSGHLKRREATRVRLVKYAAKAVRERMKELGPANLYVHSAITVLWEFPCRFRGPPRLRWTSLLSPRRSPSTLDTELPHILEQAYISAGYNVYLVGGESTILTVWEKHSTESSEAIPLYNIHFSSVALKMRTTHLLRCYRACDDRVYELGVFIKHWAHARQIDDPRNGTLPSFCYILMLLHYLMNVVKPPVIPNLQLSNIGLRNLEWVEGHETFFWDNFEEIAKASRKGKLTCNHQPGAELLRGFFTYYSPKEYNGNYRFSRFPKFNWKYHVVSVRSPGLTLKEQRNWDTFNFRPDGTRSWHFLAIEDPFNPNNNITKDINAETVYLIREEFERVNMIMNQARYISGFGWEWVNSNGLAGEDVFDDRLAPILALQN
ncbi:predicted protein [Uncinocarpus reesii 1704]|uniref:PAP-associated domain-containing protein n=1 Tax=Uncinocarpus reesii (strain UAMH 1704) TaxID=336963 RepID=C4JGP4_UNCRE|nr:uncharacterized protein UREG_02556 [Uncinocarpus reesii 1704]EEP77707.1 predicted protein [Uncinocarpus reesii 1704]